MTLGRRFWVFIARIVWGRETLDRVLASTSRKQAEQVIAEFRGNGF